MFLLDIAKASTSLAGNWAGYNPETRRQIVEEIINQQSDDLVKIGELADGPKEKEMAA